eukprot:scaffold1594_cov401-Prasinococcus_capsulatus_cf.AAC.35
MGGPLGPDMRGTKARLGQLMGARTSRPSPPSPSVSAAPAAPFEIGEIYGGVSDTSLAVKKYVASRKSRAARYHA